MNYEVDSDDEWEEEEPGESLSNSEVSRFTIFCYKFKIQMVAFNNDTVKRIVFVWFG